MLQGDTDCRYMLDEEHLFSADVGAYTTYGITAHICQRGVWVPLQTVRDISDDKDFVVRLANCCTKNRLDPAQLLDVVEDAICSAPSK